MKKILKFLCHLLWLFLLGAIFGFILETTWHYFKNGEFINKQGLWYGPFKPIYGSGLLLLTILFYKIKDKNALLIFILGILAGAIFEYAMSYLQEYLFNSYFWTYKSFKYNINGRIYLPYCLIWGLLSVLWIKFGYKYYLKLFNKLYSKKFIIISMIIFIFMIYNIILTVLIMDRYTKRLRNIEANNSFEVYIDNKYPNELVKKKMPKLRVFN